MTRSIKEKLPIFFIVDCLMMAVKKKMTWRNDGGARGHSYMGRRDMEAVILASIRYASHVLRTKL